MNRPSSMLVVLLFATLLPAHTLQCGDLADRASLAELTGVGKVIVTASARPGEDESALRAVIERRLQSAGIVIDPNLNTHLLADVHVVRETAPDGQRHFAYLISLVFQEPVRTERAPRTIFTGTTWSGSARVGRFNSDVPLQTLLDAVEAKMSDFLTAVAKDTPSRERAAGQTLEISSRLYLVPCAMPWEFERCSRAFRRTGMPAELEVVWVAWPRVHRPWDAGRLTTWRPSVLKGRTLRLL